MNEIQIFGIIISGLFSIVAFFVKQLHSDFKRVERDLSEVKSNSRLIKTEFKGVFRLLSQRIEFLERRILHIENSSAANKITNS
jgi:hypothetical protein